MILSTVKSLKIFFHCLMEFLLSQGRNLRLVWFCFFEINSSLPFGCQQYFLILKFNIFTVCVCVCTHTVELSTLVFLERFCHLQCSQIRSFCVLECSLFPYSGLLFLTYLHCFSKSSIFCNLDFYEQIFWPTLCLFM